MIMKTSALALACLALASLQPASADRYRSDIREDVREVRQDRAAVRADEARVAQERSDLAKARAREQNDLRHGNILGAIRDHRDVARETRELRAAELKLAADRAELAKDTRHLREELGQRRHHNHHD
jgi:hypothetical protein